MRAWFCVLVLLLVGAACGSTSSSTEAVINSSDQGELAQPQVEDVPAGPVASVDQVESAVAYIVATGGYVDPAEGRQAGSWTGSGFFIDNAGTLVTNNHVATGAAFLEVYVNGETEPRTASILGQDECSDLAVLRVDGEGFTSLGYYTDPFDVGLRVFSAGFPLGDPEYTLTTGIIAKRDADGATNWTSVEEVVQHDARINPGNSGGPLVSEDGLVVGINYAGNQTTDQSFAITAVDAIPIIEQLASGQDRESLGINGQALLLEDGTGGVFVQSVETGAAADRLGVEAGDLILTIEDVPAAPDGTMAGYCKILRSNGSDQPLKIELFRPSTGEILRGTVNTSEELELVSRQAVGTSSGESGDTAGSVVVDSASGSLRIPATMAGWEIRTINAGGQDLLVSVADSEAKRAQTLIATPSAFGLDGVLAVYPDAALREWWTRGVEFAVDIAFFGPDLQLVEIYRSAEPCRFDPCPIFPGRSAQFVVATPAGGLDHLANGAQLATG